MVATHHHSTIKKIGPLCKSPILIIFPWRCYHISLTIGLSSTQSQWFQWPSPNCWPHFQQKLTKHHLHVIELQPPFFSIGCEHLGHGLVMEVCRRNFYFPGHLSYLYENHQINQNFLFNFFRYKCEILIKKGTTKDMSQKIKVNTKQAKIDVLSAELLMYMYIYMYMLDNYNKDTNCSTFIFIAAQC